MSTHLSLIYAEHPLVTGPRPLLAEVYLPDGPGPFPLVTWMHSGGFRTGTRLHRNHTRLAAAFNEAGYAAAFIDYRLARPPAVLRPASLDALDALIADARAAGEEMPDSFYGARPLAVVEDCCAFLRYAVAHRDLWRLSGRLIVAGSSAGAISALNTLYLPGVLGLEAPPIATVLAFSGGFAYPGHLRATGARILALHNPADRRVPISSIRRLSDLCPDPIRLIESDRNAHGDPQLTPAEPLPRAVARCLAFDRADDPLAVDLS